MDRMLYKIGILLAGILSSWSCLAETTNRRSADLAEPARHCLSIAHRGAAGLAPENTLPAFAKACEIGVDAVELDVLLTKDSKIVVHHDVALKPEITRKSDGKWLQQAGPTLNDITLRELKTFDAGRLKPGTRYAQRYPEQVPVDGERIPTFEEVIDQMKNNCSPTTEMWVEIKTNPEKPTVTPAPETVADAVVRALRKHGFYSRARILSFDWRALVHVQKIAPDIPTVYLSLVGVSLNDIEPGLPGASPWMASLDIDDLMGPFQRPLWRPAVDSGPLIISI